LYRKSFVGKVWYGDVTAVVEEFVGGKFIVEI
jgi:hypothetical protein